MRGDGGGGLAAGHAAQRIRVGTHGWESVGLATTFVWRLRSGGFDEDFAAAAFEQVAVVEVELHRRSVVGKGETAGA